MIDTLVGSPTYLQTLATTVIPGASPPFNEVVRVQIMPDGDSALVLLAIGFVGNESGIQRYDIAANTWIDHNPSVAGIQAIGPRSAPRGPQVTLGNDLPLARDGSFATLTSYDQIYRVDLDPANTASWSLTVLTGGWTPSTGYGSTITSDGRRIVLLAPDAPLTNSTLILVDSSTGAVLATNLAIDAPWFSRMAER